MGTQLDLALPPFRLSSPPSASGIDLGLSEPARHAVRELRNRLLVFYSASAWARTQRGDAAAELRDATTEIEHAAETLRGALAALVSALDPPYASDLTATLLPETAQAALRFVDLTGDAMTTLRRSLTLYGTDGIELLADLEDALVCVRDSPRALCPLARRRSLRPL